MNDTKPKKIILKSAGINPKVVSAAKNPDAPQKEHGENKPQMSRQEYLSRNPKAAKKERYCKACEIKKRLCEDFPKTFDKKQPRPLAKGINKVIYPKYPEYSNKLIHFAIFLWCNHKEYKANLKAGAMRVDLEGNDAGLVLESEIPEFSKIKKGPTKGEQTK